MDILFNRVFHQHDTGSLHPESRKRLECFEGLTETEVSNGRPFLELFHTAEHVRAVEDAWRNGGHPDPDTVVCERSYEAALYAVGATIDASNSGDFALVRPPGHHAHTAHTSGFCLFNNVGIAAEHHARQGKKVLIFDFDGHLGDGTVKHFYRSDRVFYWSLHQHPAFPGGGDYTEIGEGDGEGYTLNIPLSPGTGDDIFLTAIDDFLPLVARFEPDIVAVSAGFDSHKDDLLLDLRVSTGAFYDVGKMLRENFSNVFATLEGGYNTVTLAQCVHNFIDGINGAPKRFDAPATESDIKLIDEYHIRSSGLMTLLNQTWSQK